MQQPAPPYGRTSLEFHESGISGFLYLTVGNCFTWKVRNEESLHLRPRPCQQFLTGVTEDIAYLLFMSGQGGRFRDAPHASLSLRFPSLLAPGFPRAEHKSGLPRGCDALMFFQSPED